MLLQHVLRSARPLALAAAVLCGSSPRAAASFHEDLHERIQQVSLEIRDEPQDARLYVQRADLYRRHAEYDPARHDLLRATELAPDLDEVLLVRARLYRDLGWTLAARLRVERFLNAHPAHGEALLIRARLLAPGAEVQAAVDAYTLALANQSPLRPEPFVERARLLSRVGRADEALRGLDEGIARLGDVPALQLEAIEVEVAEGRFADALARLDVLAARSPRQESWCKRRGDLLLAAGRAEEALAAYREARATIGRLSPRQRTAQSVRDLLLAVQDRIVALEARPPASPSTVRQP